uniref:Dolichyl-diphosphooligosaccharide-protein glycosyltransferase subunit OST5 n=1 Tax=Tanacetum cinerariifolium TaxID=118510 RepID=A0A6L2MFL5_TANCI|nr:protein heat intolerant 4 [Tanacetum cinerariifolium]
MEAGFPCWNRDFYNPFREDETEHNTVVDIMFPAEPPVVCEFDWELDELEEFTNKLIASEDLTEDQKDEFKEFVNERAREIRARAREEMDQNAFENMRFYKFYPVATLDTPDVSKVKSPFINSYEATSSRKSRSLAKELVTGAVASVFLGFGSLFLLLASGVYV